MLAFTVYGEAVPQGSMKAFVPKGWSRPVLTSDNPKLKSWRQLVAEAARQALAQLPAAERVVLLDGVLLRVAFYLPRPKSLPKWAKDHTKKPDVDKLIRAVFDALTGVVWRDDSQVVELVAVKWYAGANEVPHVDIRVEASLGRGGGVARAEDGARRSAVSAEGSGGVVTIRQTLTPDERALFPIGQAVRYKPGFGTYGYEDCLEADGRLPGVVVGYTGTRVRIELTLAKRGGSRVRRAVNAFSLIRRKDLEQR